MTESEKIKRLELQVKSLERDIAELDKLLTDQLPFLPTPDAMASISSDYMSMNHIFEIRSAGYRFMIPEYQLQTYEEYAHVIVRQTEDAWKWAGREAAEDVINQIRRAR
jgi:hypothetical protein